MSSKDLAKPGRMTKGNTTHQGSKAPPTKRLNSELSPNSSVEEITVIHHQLEELSDDMQSIREHLKQVMKKDELENFIQKTISKIINDLNENMDLTIDMKVDEKTKDLTQKIYNLEKDNTNLRNEITFIKLTCHKSEDISKEALSKANHNEQYSRKNNIKIMDIPEKTDESDERLLHTVTEILHKDRININPAKVVAIHRIPGKDNHSRPVLIQFANNSEKSKVMKHRKGMKAMGHRLVDDVTRANVLLMQRLGKSSEIEQAWYYNGSVYGQTQSGKRHKFDIYDDIMQVLKKPFQSGN